MEDLRTTALVQGVSRADLYNLPPYMIGFSCVDGIAGRFAGCRIMYKELYSEKQIKQITHLTLSPISSE